MANCNSTDNAGWHCLHPNGLGHAGSHGPFNWPRLWGPKPG